MDYGNVTYLRLERKIFEYTDLLVEMDAEAGTLEVRRMSAEGAPPSFVWTFPLGRILRNRIEVFAEESSADCWRSAPLVSSGLGAVIRIGDRDAGSAARCGSLSLDVEEVTGRKLEALIESLAGFIDADPEKLELVRIGYPDRGPVVIEGGNLEKIREILAENVPMGPSVTSEWGDRIAWITMRFPDGGFDCIVRDEEPEWFLRITEGLRSA